MGFLEVFSTTKVDEMKPEHVLISFMHPPTPSLELLAVSARPWGFPSFLVYGINGPMY